MTPVLRRFGPALTLINCIACASAQPAADSPPRSSSATAAATASAGTAETAPTSSATVPPEVSSAAVSAAPTSLAPAPSPSKTLFVDSKRVPCQGEGVSECLRVRESESAPWDLFYRTIEGFTFEPGFTYELRVVIERVTERPADAPSRRHRMLELVSKKKAP
ncbi:MAG: DUF4377 domain-containing protein [Deltaproteobacteria bacterium]|nr:DUF4377 domain-containing protein [Deltaproteobacteria bacterium]